MSYPPPPNITYAFNTQRENKIKMLYDWIWLYFLADRLLSTQRKRLKTMVSSMIKAPSWFNLFYGNVVSGFVAMYQMDCWGRWGFVCVWFSIAYLYLCLLIGMYSTAIYIIFYIVYCRFVRIIWSQWLTWLIVCKWSDLQQQVQAEFLWWHLC